MEEKGLPHDHGSHQHLSVIQTLLEHTENFQIIADVFKNLGDTTRVRIFWMLCHMEECVVNIAAMLQMSSPAVSHHLRPLRASGLLVSRREGKEVYYRASDTPQSHLLHQMIEQVMEIACPELEQLPEELDHAHSCICHSHLPHPDASQDLANDVPSFSKPGYRAEQIAMVQAMHDELTQHLDQRRSVEDLARECLMNSTTFKQLFKEIYGMSIAAHIKEHRMEEAARLLRESSQSIAEIARAVGYESQSKFTAAFKDYYHMLPRDYRKG